jgi:hypothetical protein
LLFSAHAIAGTVHRIGNDVPPPDNGRFIPIAPQPKPASDLDSKPSPQAIEDANMRSDGCEKIEGEVQTVYTNGLLIALYEYRADVSSYAASSGYGSVGGYSGAVSAPARVKYVSSTLVFVKGQTGGNIVDKQTISCWGKRDGVFQYPAGAENPHTVKQYQHVTPPKPQ